MDGVNQTQPSRALIRIFSSCVEQPRDTLSLRDHAKISIPADFAAHMIQKFGARERAFVPSIKFFVWNPVKTVLLWIPAFAGMTIWLFVISNAVRDLKKISRLCNNLEMTESK